MKEALKLALEALEYWDVHGKLHQPTEEAITAIKAALAQDETSSSRAAPVQEPVAYSGNGTAGREADVRPTGFFFQMPKPEQKQEPVAWVDPTTLHHLKIGLEGVHLVYETEMVNSLPLYDKPQFQNPKQCLERLIRIMGTFDLATGHADTFDALLDSLESELRDVLGYYRQQRTWVGLTDDERLEAAGIEGADEWFWKVVEAIEAKLKEKNT